MIARALRSPKLVNAPRVQRRSLRLVVFPRSEVIGDERPRAHREYGKWPPERIVSWPRAVGPHVGEVAASIMSRRTHPETGYRACLGVLHLGDRFGHERVDAACKRALHIGSPTAKSVNAILKNGLDRPPLAAPARPLFARLQSP